ncbi:MAG: regulatory protein RecX [Oscillospiraceae bacterium]|nr:regulatory protein RecX [Candidatus Limimonas coprohippi]MCQ2487903.1 recombination regulator RecX [Clostridia bacterium]
MLLTAKHGRGNKIHLSIDGEYAITTTERVWYDSPFSDNYEISEEEWRELCDTINFEKMYERALDLLELRDHSQKEILDKLVVKFGLDKKEQAKLVLEKLSENGLLDDEHFASIYADELIRRKHVSPAGLRAALSAKGIDRKISDIIIEEANIDSVESINILLDTKFKTADLLDERQCDKVVTSLYRLGFMLSDIRDVLAERQHILRLELLENM